MKPLTKVSLANTATPKRKRKSRDELNAQARARKRQKKHSGHAAGSRTHVEPKKPPSHPHSTPQDPRTGSKVPVPLLVNHEEKMTTTPEMKGQLSPEAELATLENNERLDVLLDRLDSGEILSKEDQAYVNLTLDRIDALMEQLGIERNDNDEETVKNNEQKQEDIFLLLKRSNPKDMF